MNALVVRNKMIFWIILAALALLGTLLASRANKKGEWICKNGDWVAKGEVLTPKPLELCD